MSLLAPHGCRQVVLDTETTGLNEHGPVEAGHYIIEVGAIELMGRTPGERFHRYIRAPIPSTPESLAIHGITEAFLADKPTFAEIAEDLAAFLQGAELIVHNAPFDVSFLKAEFSRYHASQKASLPPFQLESRCTVCDTLVMARQRFPGSRNSLDALCQRFKVDRSHRGLHGAMVDTLLLMEVYLAMTQGQIALPLAEESPEALTFLANAPLTPEGTLPSQPSPWVEVAPSEEEQREHERLLAMMRSTYPVSPLYDLWPASPAP